MRELADLLRRHRDAKVDDVSFSHEDLAAFRGAVAAFRRLLGGAGVYEPATAAIVEAFEALLSDLDAVSADPAHLLAIGLIRTELPETLVTGKGAFRKYSKLTAWKAVASSAAEAKRLCEEACEAYEACCEAADPLWGRAAQALLCRLVGEIRPLVADFQRAKRSAAALDFDDLLYAARDVLRRNETVRNALARRFTRILVDEFQDTDPIQTEIFQRLTSDPPAGQPQAPLDRWSMRPGALFLVGDPQQAIYRFRGANVATYVKARDAMRAADPNAVAPIGVNFRSTQSIIDWVNRIFATPLSAPGQPGFGKLTHFHLDQGDGPFVAALDVPDTENAEARRYAEAEAVAALCERLIGGFEFHDRKQNARRRCGAGDIALLAPAGTDLWIYEAALEERRISVATQAGKGMFRRQEVHDLVALARALADPRDSLALGALLRGPLVGLTEEELLDIAHALPVREDGGLAHLRLWTPLDDVGHPLARETLSKLQSLANTGRKTTPYHVLAQAVEELRVRAILSARSDGEAERVLANVDRFLEMSRPYAVRGLKAFAAAMQAAWDEAGGVVEGRPDAEERSVSLITMHSAKGLEWPVVIPINTGGVTNRAGVVYELETNKLSMPVFGAHPTGHGEAAEAHKADVAAERIRVWYVACTRAEHLLVMPRHAKPPKASEWCGLVPFGLETLPAIDPSAWPQRPPEARPAERNDEDRSAFAEAGLRIRQDRSPVTWITPSRKDAEFDAVDVAPEPNDEIVAAPPPAAAGAPPVKGSRLRGVVLHKLIEEVLNGETQETEDVLAARAEELVGQLTDAGDAAEWADASELTATVLRTLALPEIAALRPNLWPETPVATSWTDAEGESVIHGIVDALAVDEAGKVTAVVDWKSDVQPSDETVRAYRGQIQAYLDATGAARGLLVFATSGAIVQVPPTQKQP